MRRRFPSSVCRSANATFADLAAFAELTESGLKGEFAF